MFNVLQGCLSDRGVSMIWAIPPKQEVIVIELDMRNGTHVIPANPDESRMILGVLKVVWASIEEDSPLTFSMWLKGGVSKDPLIVFFWSWIAEEVFDRCSELVFIEVILLLLRSTLQFDFELGKAWLHALLQGCLHLAQHIDHVSRLVHFLPSWL